MRRLRLGRRGSRHSGGGGGQRQRLLQGADLALQFTELVIQGRIFLIQRHARLRLPSIHLGRASGDGRPGAARRRGTQRGSRRRRHGKRRHEHARRTHQSLGPRARCQRGGIGRRRAGRSARQRHRHGRRNDGPDRRTGSDGGGRYRRQPQRTQTHDGATTIAQ